MRTVFFGIFLLLGFYATLSYRSSGEVLRTMSGTVERCEQLGGAAKLHHATLKAENGTYIIASLAECRPGMKVSILIKRGALYFNTVYAAELH